MSARCLLHLTTTDCLWICGPGSPLSKFMASLADNTTEYECGHVSSAEIQKACHRRHATCVKIQKTYRKARAAHVHTDAEDVTQKSCDACSDSEDMSLMSHNVRWDRAVSSPDRSSNTDWFYLCFYRLSTSNKDSRDPIFEDTSVCLPCSSVSLLATYRTETSEYKTFEWRVDRLQGHCCEDP